MNQLWGSYLFWKCSKLNLDCNTAEKNSENVFCFRDNSIGISCVKLSLLRREYLSSAVSVLTTSPKILHITKADFFQSICVHIDQ